MALSVVRPSWTPPLPHYDDMTWEELARLSDRELLLLLHQRLEQLENKVDSRWSATWKVLAWAVGALFSMMALFIAGHAAHLW